MKKATLIASAVFAALSAPSVSAVETSFFGDIQLGIVNSDTGTAGKKTTTNMDGSTFEFGFELSEDLGNGMTGFAKANFAHEQANESTPGANNGDTINDESYVGIKGDFGTVTVGVQYDAAGFACGGTDIFNYNGGAACGNGAYNDPLDNAITYSNTFGAVTIVVGATVDGSGSGGQPAAGDHTLLAINFEGEGFTLGAQMTGYDSTVTINAAGDLDLAGLSKDDSFVIGGTLTLGEVVLGLTVSDSGNPHANVDTEAYAVAVTLPVGGGQFVAAFDGGDGLANEETNIGFHNSLSDNVYYGAEYTTYSSTAPGGVDPEDYTGIYLGMTF